MPAHPPSLPRRAHSLPAKVALVVLLGVAAREAVLAWTGVEWTRHFFREAVERSFPDLAERSAARVDAWLAAGRAQVELAARDPDLRRSGGPGDEAAARVLEAALARSAILDGLWLADDQGRLRVARGAGGAALDPLPRAPRSAGLHQLASDETAPLPLAVAAVSDDRGRTVAWLAGRYRTGAIAQLLSGDSLPGVGRGYITDATGRVLFAGSAGGPERLPLERLRAPAGARTAGYRGADGGERIGTLRALEQLGWHLVVVADLNEGFAQIHPLLRRILLLDLALLLVLAWVTYRLTAGLVQPLRALWEGARRIAAGDLEVEVPEADRADELGALTRTFNAMARKLADDQVEIGAAHRMLREQNQALQAANEVLAQLSITDGLTKLHNHRFFQDHLTRELKRVTRTGEPLAMLLIDIDDFKALNDSYGHATGDAVLARIAQVMNANVRESDLLARYGGEEFVVLATADLEGALRLAEKLRMAVMETPILVDEAMRVTHVTVSVGVARYEGDRRAFFRDADRALYGAKAAGKNCVVVDDGTR